MKVCLILSKGTFPKKAHIMQNMINSDDKMPHTNVNTASNGIVKMANIIPTVSMNFCNDIISFAPNIPSEQAA